jgi:outer membrane immunogenic protein
MKKILLSATALSLALTASAFAADLPSRKAPIIIPPPPPTWTGFYVGLNAGGTFDASSNIYVTNAPVFVNGTPLVFPTASATSAAAAAAGTAWLGNNNSGFIGGGQVGYNYQFGAGGLGWGSGWVAGVEADIQGVAGTGGSSSSVSGAPLAVPPFPPGFAVLSVTNVSKSLDYLGTVRGRIGFLFTPTLLVYGTGGLAYGGVSSNTSQFQAGTGPVPFFGPSVTAAWGSAGSFSDTRVGWTAGGGLEWMFAPNWSAKLEYLYYNLGSVTYSSGVSGSFGNIAPIVGQPFFLNTTWTTARFNGHIVRAGVNYHFNWGVPAPVLAKY